MSRYEPYKEPTTRFGRFWNGCEVVMKQNLNGIFLNSAPINCGEPGGAR